MLRAYRIWHELSPCWRQSLRSIDCIDQLTSTQIWLLEQSALQRDQWQLCTTLWQTAGHGRLGRLWHSSAQQVAFSWRGWVSIEPESIGILSLVAALAVKDALMALGVSNIQLKWPNDIFVSGKKLAGMLISVCQYKTPLTEIVLGIGLNRHQDALPDDAIALDKMMASLPSVEQLIAQITMQWLVYRAMLSDREQRIALLTAWQDSALWLGEQVQVRLGDQLIRGNMLGVNTQGLLRLLTPEGEQHYAANDIQLRLPMYD